MKTTAPRSCLNALASATHFFAVRKKKFVALLILGTLSLTISAANRFSTMPPPQDGACAGMQLTDDECANAGTFEYAIKGNSEYRCFADGHNISIDQVQTVTISFTDDGEVEMSFGLSDPSGKNLGGLFSQGTYQRESENNHVLRGTVDPGVVAKGGASFEDRLTFHWWGFRFNRTLSKQVDEPWECYENSSFEFQQHEGQAPPQVPPEGENQPDPPQPDPYDPPQSDPNDQPGGDPVSDAEVPTAVKVGNVVVPIAGSVAGALLAIVLIATKGTAVTAEAADIVAGVNQEQPQPGSSDEQPVEGDFTRRIDEAGVIKEDLVAEPDQEELHRIRFSSDKVVDLVKDFFRGDIPEARGQQIVPEKIKYVETNQFNWQYERAFKVENSSQASGMANVNTFEAFIDKIRGYTYTPVHEAIHLASNPQFSNQISQDMDEATTEYFTKQVAKSRKGPTLTAYDHNVKVIADMVDSIGEGTLRKAYFGEGEESIKALKRAVDKKYGRGAFKKIVELVGNGKDLRARTLIRKLKIPGK
jgi:hypothetical protein